MVTFNILALQDIALFRYNNSVFGNQVQANDNMFENTAFTHKNGILNLLNLFKIFSRFIHISFILRPTLLPRVQNI